MGLMVGILVGALTLGSAPPHLFNALGGVDWRVPVGGVVGDRARRGRADRPRGARAQSRARRRASIRAPSLTAWRDVPLRLANLGYLGHMWELYAMWAWIGVFLQRELRASMPRRDARRSPPSSAAFATIAAGAHRLRRGGLARRSARPHDDHDRGDGDLRHVRRHDRLAVRRPPRGRCVAVCIVWGVTIVADSAQFSASIAELSEPARVGTMLTVQTALGFTLTLVTIQAMPYCVARLGWRYAFAPARDRARARRDGRWRACARTRRRVKLAGGRR